MTEREKGSVVPEGQTSEPETPKAGNCEYAVRPFDHEDFEDSEYCTECDDGYVYNCVDDMCIDAEYGCQLCQRRCDYCNPNIAPKGPTEP